MAMRLCKQPAPNHIGSRPFLPCEQPFYERRSAFGQYENGAQHITRQVSSRIQKGAIGRKRLVKEWQSAADKVRVIKLYCSYSFTFDVQFFVRWLFAPAATIVAYFCVCVCLCVFTFHFCFSTKIPYILPHSYAKNGNIATHRLCFFTHFVIYVPQT